jgi:hypothetical protein
MPPFVTDHADGRVSEAARCVALGPTMLAVQAISIVRPVNNARLALLIVVALLVGAAGGFAFGANRSDDRADNCQDAAQHMYDAFYRSAPNSLTAFEFTDDYCPIDQIQN